MAKYNLQVAVMQDDEPIMFIYSRDYNFKFIYGSFSVYGELKKAFPCLDWCLWSGNDNEGDIEAGAQIEYVCSPDREREDMELLAIWQKVED